MTRWRSNALDVADVDEKRNVVSASRLSEYTPQRSSLDPHVVETVDKRPSASATTYSALKPERRRLEPHLVWMIDKRPSVSATTCGRLKPDRCRIKPHVVYVVDAVERHTIMSARRRCGYKPRYGSKRSWPTRSTLSSIGARSMSPTRFRRLTPQRS